MKTGDKFPWNFKLVRPVENGEKVKMPDGTELKLSNPRQNLWWAAPVSYNGIEPPPPTEIMVCTDRLKPSQERVGEVLAQMVDDLWKP